MSSEASYKAPVASSNMVLAEPSSTSSIVTSEADPPPYSNTRSVMTKVALIQTEASYARSVSSKEPTMVYKEASRPEKPSYTEKSSHSEHWLKRLLMRGDKSNKGTSSDETVKTNNTHVDPIFFKAQQIPMDNPREHKATKLHIDGNGSSVLDIHNGRHFYLVPKECEPFDALMLVWTWDRDLLSREHYSWNGRYVIWYLPTEKIAYFLACNEEDDEENRQSVRYEEDFTVHEGVEAWFTERMVEATRLIYNAKLKHAMSQSRTV